MTPLKITAHLAGAVSIPAGHTHLDGILAHAVVVRDEIPLTTIVEDMVAVEIPLEREPGGRYHLCSAAVVDWEEQHRRFVNRRFPAEIAVQHSKMRTVNVSSGATKSHRLPLQSGHVQGDKLLWWAIGDAREVEALLAFITHVGKKRSVGLGEVRRWEVTAPNQEELWDGFPVVRGGRALRNLPADDERAANSPVSEGRLTYPYHDHRDRCLVFTP